MKITFLMPGYNWAPSGGHRVVYEYANRLTQRGHEITIVNPLRLKYLPSQPFSLRGWLRTKALEVKGCLSKPRVDWHPIDQRVKLIFTRDSSPRNIPDADVLFATSCVTVQSVLDCPRSKGEKCYFVQGFESYAAPQELVDATWKAPLHKIGISQWLVDRGNELGCSPLTYIPNGVDQTRYRLICPIETRSRRVAMIYSSAPVKGSADGIEALRLAREVYPDLKVTLFGVSRAAGVIPDWAEYHRNPPQEFIVDEIYNKSQIFISTSWVEGFALPPAEAGLCGCAIASTDSLGVREFLRHEETGLLSPPKDPKALAQNIGLLLGNETLRLRLARAIQSDVRRLQWEKSAGQFEKFLENVLNGTKPSQSRTEILT